MRTIAHISDLHFGRADPAIVAALAHDLKESAPDLVAVSGDLTQRARRREFAAARDFLQGLGLPVLAVPGNHDIPLFDVARRLLQPLDRYHRYIHAEDNPFYVDDEMAVLGLNTARRTTFGDGRLSLSQIAVVRERFERLPPALAKILVTHHPFLPAPAGPRQALVGRGLLGLQACEVCGVDVLLTGHLHRGFTGRAQPSRGHQAIDPGLPGGDGRLHPSARRGEQLQPHPPRPAPALLHRPRLGPARLPSTRAHPLPQHRRRVAAAGVSAVSLAGGIRAA